MANGTERSGGVPSWVWGVAAAVGVIGFLVWISVAAQPAATVAVTETEDTTAAGAEMTGEVITLQTIADGTAALQGRDVMLQEIPVAAAMGQQAFWVDLPSQQPFLIRIGEQAAAAGAAVQPGDTVDISGRIVPMTDSVISAWLDTGAITQNQEAEARFATSFLNANIVRPAQQ